MKIADNNFQIETTPTGITVKTDKFNVSITQFGICLYGEKGELLIDAYNLYGADKGIRILKRHFAKIIENDYLITLTRK